MRVLYPEAGHRDRGAVLAATRSRQPASEFFFGELQDQFTDEWGEHPVGGRPWP